VGLIQRLSGLLNFLYSSTPGGSFARLRCASTFAKASAYAKASSYAKASVDKSVDKSARPVATAGLNASIPSGLPNALIRLIAHLGALV